MKYRCICALLAIAALIMNRIPVYANEEVRMTDRAGHELKMSEDGVAAVDGELFFKIRNDGNVYTKIVTDMRDTGYKQLDGDTFCVSENNADISIVRVDKSRHIYAPVSGLPSVIRKRRNLRRTPEVKLITKGDSKKVGEILYINGENPGIEIEPGTEPTYVRVKSGDEESLVRIFRREIFSLKKGCTEAEVWSENGDGRKEYAEIPFKKIIYDPDAPSVPKIRIDGDVVIEDSGRLAAKKSLTIEVKAEDECSGVEKYIFVTENGREYEADKLQIEAGSEKRITVYAVDRAGNKSEKAELNKRLIIDASGPEILADVTADENGEMSISARAHDDLLGVKAISVYLDDKKLSASKIPEIRCSTEIKNLEVGMHVLKIIALDEIDNKTVKEYVIDKEQTVMPELEVMGVESFSTVKTGVKLKTAAAAENRVSFEVFYKDKAGNEHRYVQRGRVFEASEEGSYIVKTTAEDKYENKTSIVKSFMIDKTSSELPDIKKLDKKYLRNIKIKTMDRFINPDFSACRTEMLLNNEVYDGHKIDRPGHYVLTLRSVDAAGNKSKASAEFIIRGRK
ncbi:MAG: hypothetical protein K6F39_07870 [Lachnospiraceae bacterium]|nr:hypothetical protein [Lachnospiraceae bacterium]